MKPASGVIFFILIIIITCLDITGATTPSPEPYEIMCIVHAESSAEVAVALPGAEVTPLMNGMYMAIVYAHDADKTIEALKASISKDGDTVHRVMDPIALPSYTLHRIWHAAAFTLTVVVVFLAGIVTGSTVHRWAWNARRKQHDKMMLAIVHSTAYRSTSTLRNPHSQAWFS